MEEYYCEWCGAQVRRKRAPNGYRVIRWADGFYHVYPGGECLDEVLSRDEAYTIALRHAKPCCRAKQLKQKR
jgi:hypothetical protein